MHIETQKMAFAVCIVGVKSNENVRFLLVAKPTSP